MNPADELAKLRKELCIFFVGIGVLLAMAAYFSLANLGDNAPPLWGLSRWLAIGVPVAILAVAHLAAGGLLGMTGSRAFCIFGAVSSTALAVFYFVFMFSATGTVPISVISLVIVAIPVVVWSRAVLYLSPKKSWNEPVPGGEI
jgi:hypothetical protein